MRMESINGEFVKIIIILSTAVKSGDFLVKTNDKISIFPDS